MCTCPHCGEHTTRYPEVLEDSSTRIAAVHEKTQSLDDAIRRLNEQRANLQRELNAIQSLTKDLPPETLSTIFEFAYPPLDFTSRSIRHSYSEDHKGDPPETLFVLTLAAVSSYWRQVVLSTPRLWATLTLDIQPKNQITTTLPSNIAILRMYLHHSKAVPFSLEINWDPTVISSVNNSFDGTLKDIILRNASRFRTLRLSTPPTTWPSCISENADRFTVLEDVRLGWPSVRQYDHLQKEVLFGGINTLRRVMLKNVTPKVELPWGSITVLTLYAIPIDTCVQLLICCPNLVEYRSHVVVDELSQLDLGNPWLDHDTISLRDLEILEWSCHPSSWNDALLLRLDLPNIRTLAFVGFHGYMPQQAFWNFVIRLPSSLVGLELAHRPWDCDMLRTLFERMDQLERLVIRDCGWETIHNTFLTLNPREELGGTRGEGTWWLPALKDLHIKYYYDYDTTETRQIPGLLAELMKARRGRVDGGLCFGLELEKSVDWGILEKRKDEGLSCEGVTGLRVYHNSNLVFTDL